MQRLPRRRLPPFAARFLLLLLLAGCTEIRLISDYDEQTDARLSAVQRDLESLLTHLERSLGSPAGCFSRYAPTYNSLRVDLRTLSVRAAARPKNRLQVDQLAEVRRQLDLFAEAHRKGLRPEEIAVFRRGFNQSFRAMIRLELAKKRGDVQN